MWSSLDVPPPGRKEEPLLHLKIRIPKTLWAFFRKLGQQKIAHEVRLLRSNHYCTLALMGVGQVMGHKVPPKCCEFLEDIQPDCI